MWSDLIIGLDLPPAGEILLAGDDIADVDLPVGSGHRYDTGSLVLITQGEAPSDGASMPNTGLESDSLDLVILRDAAGSLTRLVNTLFEAFRILKPGGGLMLKEFDAETLLDSRPQRYPQLLMSQMYPRVAAYLRHRHPRQMDIGMSLIKAGFKDADSYVIDAPVGHFDDFQKYADWVAVEGWRGMDELTPDERQSLLDRLPDLMKSVAPAGEFDDVDPVIIARAYKPV